MITAGADVGAGEAAGGGGDGVACGVSGFSGAVTGFSDFSLLSLCTPFVSLAAAGLPSALTSFSPLPLATP